ncbi:unnamed protein product [Prorocentrum cordatum]|uniref:Uncharacterized protein n=1 Tax=Prorocentrum cordatum TaxID=2364126 RepID=A0ABN9URS2_9DINO|nr:unnamed protein product [Polarella glacialis]
MGRTDIDPMHWIGNRWADWFAQLGVSSVAISPDFAKTLQRRMEDAINMAKFMAWGVCRISETQAWEPQEHEPKLPPRVKAARTPQIIIIQHDYVEENGTIRCMRCNCTAATYESKRRLDCQPCRATALSRLQAAAASRVSGSTTPSHYFGDQAEGDDQREAQQRKVKYLLEAARGPGMAPTEDAPAPLSGGGDGWLAPGTLALEAPPQDVAQASAGLIEELADDELMLVEAAGPVTVWTSGLVPAEAEPEALPEAEQAMASAARPRAAPAGGDADGVAGSGNASRGDDDAADVSAGRGMEVPALAGALAAGAAVAAAGQASAAAAPPAAARPRRVGRKRAPDDADGAAGKPPSQRAKVRGDAAASRELPRLRGAAAAHQPGELPAEDGADESEGRKCYLRPAFSLMAASARQVVGGTSDSSRSLAGCDLRQAASEVNEAPLRALQRRARMVPPSREKSNSASPPLAPPPAAASVEGGGAVSVGEGGAGRGPEQPPAGLPADPSPVADNAHELVLRSPFVLCRRCGAYVSAERGAKRLKDLCPGPLPPLDRCSPAERERRRRREKLLQGLHPTSGASLGAYPASRRGSD